GSTGPQQKEDRHAGEAGSGPVPDPGPFVNPQGPLPPRPGEHLPPSFEQGKQGSQPIDQPLQPRPTPQPELPKTM
ncbi:MAG TPA: hypothetical protein VHG53_02990, partial [Candidatus Limnocylindria bacterium]|nr:hypothetical protein [Candidatus Limnocylindria bacterium]